jgi:hypothetical protein
MRVSPRTYIQSTIEKIDNQGIFYIVHTKTNQIKLSKDVLKNVEPKIGDVITSTHLLDGEIRSPLLGLWLNEVCLKQV